MKTRRLIRNTTVALMVVVASLWFAPGALAHSHVRVGIGISVPGVSVDVGNCWRCGYWAAPVYYQPAYPARVYYPAPAYYQPRPVYYGYSYAYPAPRYYHRRYHHHDRYRHHDWRGHRGGYYHHRHH